MQESLSRALGWFRARSNPQKTAIAATIILALVLASPVVWAIAAVAFIVAVVGLIVQAVRRRPVRIWLIAGGSALVAVMVFATFVESIYGPVDVRDRDRVSRVEEPVAEEDPGIEQPGVEDEILTAVAGADRRGSVEDVEVTGRDDGDGTRYDVVVRVTSREAADETLLEAMEDHEHVYRVVHTSGAADRIGDVAVVSRVDGPNMTPDPAYETTLDRETAREIDWGSAADVQNLPEYWEERYVARELRAQR